MTISKDLFLAILSMDSYNRGYSPGIADLGGFGSGIGLAIIKAVDIPTGSEPESFNAIAYEMTGASTTGIADGTTIISYRGTARRDFPWEISKG